MAKNAIATVAQIPLGNDWLYEFDIYTYSATDGSRIAAVALTGVKARLSLTQKGTALAGTEVVLTERNGKPGRYYGTIDRADVDAALAAYVGKTVWEQLDDDTGIRASRKLLVVKDADM